MHLALQPTQQCLEATGHAKRTARLEVAESKGLHEGQSKLRARSRPGVSSVLGLSKPRYDVLHWKPEFVIPVGQTELRGAHALGTYSGTGTTGKFGGPVEVRGFERGTEMAFSEDSQDRAGQKGLVGDLGCSIWAETTCEQGCVESRLSRVPPKVHGQAVPLDPRMKLNNGRARWVLCRRFRWRRMSTARNQTSFEKGRNVGDFTARSTGCASLGRCM